jgi:hypothetical protein
LADFLARSTGSTITGDRIHTHLWGDSCMLWSSKPSANNLRTNNRRQRAATSRPRHLEPLEQRALLTAATGHVEVFANGVISGWAFDADSPTDPVTVRLVVDGNFRDVTASTVRPDGKLGFSTTVGPGSHNVIVTAIDTQTSGVTVFKTGVLVNPSPTGAAVLTSGGTGVAGFASDINAAAQVVSVEVWQNGTLFQTVNASQSIPGLVAGHSFSVTGLTAGSVVDVFALDAPSGQRKLLFTNDKPSRGGVENFTVANLKGWVYDPDLGTDPIDVTLLVDGVVKATQTANTTDTTTPNLATLTGTADRQYNFNIASFIGPGTHNVTLIAKETGTASKTFTVLASKNFTNGTPAGGFLVTNNTVVAGWVGDLESLNNPITITVKVDGVTKGTTTTSFAVPQTVKPAGAPYTAKGYAIGISGVSSTAPHFIQVFATDALSGQTALVSSKVIQNHAPIGQFLVLNEDVVSGWAEDPDNAGQASKVRIIMDGHDYGLYTAGNIHTTLPASIQHHGFDVPTPTNIPLNQNHVISVYAVDTFTGAQVLLGTKAFFNHAPIGVANITRTGASGWTFDPDEPNATIRVTMTVRPPGATSFLSTQVLVSANRPVAGVGNHGFVLNFVQLLGGAIRAGSEVRLYGLDAGATEAGGVIADVFV